MKINTVIALIGLVSTICVIEPVKAVPISDGLLLWLDATDNSTIFDKNGLSPDQIGFSGLVSQWIDKSNNNIVASSYNSQVNIPEYSATGMNGNATIVFTTEGFFDLSSSLKVSDHTLFIVTEMFDDGDNRGPWLGNSTAGLGHGMPGSFFNDRDRYFIGTTERLFGFVPESAPTTDTIVAENRNNDLVDIDENGIQVVTGLQALGDFNIDTVGWFPFSDRTFFGEISEILMYDRSLSAVEMNEVGYSLAQKYALDTAYTAPVSVPEPSTITLICVGLIGIGLMSKKTGTR